MIGLLGPLAALAAGAAAFYWIMLRRPWGGFATFDAIGRAHVLAQATVIGAFDLAAEGWT